MLSNFTDLKTYLDRNHVDLNDPSGDLNEGKHKFVSMPEQGAPPSTMADELAMYTQDVSGISELFVRRESDGQEIQFTGQAGTNSTILPSGLKLIYETGVAGAGAVTNVTFPDGGFTTALTVVISDSSTNVGNEVALRGGTLTPTGFQASAPVSRNFNYIAVGIA
jgi:hypothetical protein